MLQESELRLHVEEKKGNFERKLKKSSLNKTFKVGDELEVETNSLRRWLKRKMRAAGCWVDKSHSKTGEPGTKRDNGIEWIQRVTFIIKVINRVTDCVSCALRLGNRELSECHQFLK